VHEAGERMGVDGVVPFAVDNKTATAKLRQWVESRWFAPTEFKRRGVQGKFTGIYLPYWTYDAMTHTAWQGQRGEYYYVEVGSGQNRRRERRTRWTHRSGSFARFFDDVLVCAATTVKRKLMHALEPWPLTMTIPFTPDVLAGYLAMTYDVSLEDGFNLARQRMASSLQAEVRRRIGGDTQRITHIATRYGALTYKHLLLPVWMLAYRFHDKTYQVVVNACTGEVQGQRPWSWVKILLAVIAGLVVIGGGAAAVALGQG
jgi:hypothetical protein